MAVSEVHKPFHLAYGFVADPIHQRIISPERTDPTHAVYLYSRTKEVWCHHPYAIQYPYPFVEGREGPLEMANAWIMTARARARIVGLLQWEYAEEPAPEPAPWAAYVAGAWGSDR
jgi:hypothetical protein